MISSSSHSNKMPIDLISTLATSKAQNLNTDTRFGLRKLKMSFMNKRVAWTWKTTSKVQINTKS